MLLQGVSLDIRCWKLDTMALCSTKTWFNNLVLICANLSNHANLSKLVAFYLNYLQITNKIVANYH